MLGKSFYVSLFCFVVCALIAAALGDFGNVPGLTVVFGLFSGVSLFAMAFAAAAVSDRN